jgi:Zn-finger nucleic acid-binding protein
MLTDYFIHRNPLYLIRSPIAIYWYFSHSELQAEYVFSSSETDFGLRQKVIFAPILFFTSALLSNGSLGNRETCCQAVHHCLGCNRRLPGRRKEMNCPHDNEPLSKVEIFGFELDKCPKCSGIWLDFGELDGICTLSLTEIESHFLEYSVTTDPKPDGDSGYMRCPRCPDGRLQKTFYTYMHPVSIDRCEKCLGVWLDHFELDAILAEKMALDEEFSIHQLRPFLQSALMANRSH